MRTLIVALIAYVTASAAWHLFTGGVPSITEFVTSLVFSSWILLLLTPALAIYLAVLHTSRARNCRRFRFLALMLSPLISVLIAVPTWLLTVPATGWQLPQATPSTIAAAASYLVVMPLVIAMLIPRPGGDRDSSAGP